MQYELKMSLNYAEIGERIRQNRVLRHMTQDVLSEACGLSTGFLGHIERGTRKPSLETLSKISQILNVSLDILVFGECDNISTQLKILSLSLEGKNPDRVQGMLKTCIALAEQLDSD